MLLEPSQLTWTCFLCAAVTRKTVDVTNAPLDRLVLTVYIGTTHESTLFLLCKYRHQMIKSNKGNKYYEK